VTTRRRLAALLVAVTLAIPAGEAGLTAQNPRRDGTREPEPIATSPNAPARTVRIDAVVTDRKGAPIRNLRADDFEVVENGVVQRIEAVEARGGSSRPGETAPLFPIASDEDEVRAARQPGTRVIAMLLDEFHVSPGEPTERVRTAMRQFMDELVRPSDLLLVLKPLESVTELRFTRDHQAVRAAIDSFQGRKGNYEARSAFERQYLGSAPEAVRAGRAQIVLSGLRAIIMKLGDLRPDRSAVVVASEGFARDGSQVDRERRVPDVQGLVRGASRFNVAVYVLDPGDAGASDADDSGDSPDRERAIMRSIAISTGGDAASGAPALDATLVRLANDLDDYYVLTYTSTHPSDGRFYDVQVRAKRPDARVKTRTGYWAPLRTSLTAGSRGSSPGTPLRALRRSPLIETWVGFTVDATGVPHAIFTWEPVAFRGPRPVGGEPHSVELRVSTTSGGSLYEGVVIQARGAPGIDDATSAVFEAAPGRVQLDLVILRQDGTQIDTGAQDLDLPDTSKPDPRILPPQVFRASSAREFRETLANASAAPVPAREFRRTERLLLRIPTYSPSGAEIALTATLVNRMGQPMRALQPIAPTSDGVRQYDLPLGWLAPGEYRVELTAKTQTAAAREAIRFRITG
jgi:VWFA-related protein